MSTFRVLRAMSVALLAAACAGSPTPGSTSVPASIASSEPGHTSLAGCHPPRNPTAAPVGKTIAATIDLGCEAGAVAVAGDSVWVVPHLDRVALRIDPVDNTVIAATPLGDRGPGAEIAANEAMIWASVSSLSYDLERLVRIDPINGEIIASVDAKAGFPVIGAGFVWASGPAGTFRIDPATNTVAAIVKTGDCWIVVLGERVFCIGDAVALEIDPTTDTVTPLAGAPNGLPVEAVDGLIWGVHSRLLWAFDPQAGEVRAELPPPEGAATWSPDAVVLDGALWATATTLEGAPNRLVRVNRQALAIDCVVETPTSEFGIGAGFGAVWLPVQRQPWLARIEPAC